MPLRRRTLTQAERTEHLVRAEQLRASGVEIEIPEHWRDRNRTLDIIVASPAESRVFESYTGGIFYAVLVRLLARFAVTLTDCDITTEFDDQIVMESFRDPVFTLGGQEYRQSEVLNHRIENNLRLVRGEVAEGLIVATGLHRIPTKYDEFAVPFKIVFSDQFGDGFPAIGMLSVSRQAQRDYTKMQRGTGLYGGDATGKPRELSVEEDARRRYLELVAKEKNAEQQM